MTKYVKLLSKANIQTLYWKKNLSIYKIAKKFDVNPQLIRYYAIKYNIPLRPPKSIQKEKFKISKNILKKMYVKDKLPTTKIAEKFGIKSDYTINLKLRKFGIVPRSMSEAKMKYVKTNFSGNIKEKAYLLGLRIGDLAVTRNSLQIRISNSTTHNAQIRMIEKVLKKYTHIHKFLNKDKRGIKEFCIYGDLNKSFEFLLDKPKILPKWILRNKEIFFHFLSGYSDAESNWNISKHGKNSVQIEFNLRSNDKEILRQIDSKLNIYGFRSKFRLFARKGERATYGEYRKNIYSTRVIKKSDVIKLAKILLPLSMHDEKIWKMNLISKLDEEAKWNEIRNKVLNIRNRIKSSIIKQDI